MLELRPATSVEVLGTSSRIAPAQRLEHSTGNAHEFELQIRRLKKINNNTIITRISEFFIGEKKENENKLLI